ncbi:copper resistance CopC family protein [Leifsonia poae]|uniref:copper resistance CopC family protein n=1 Tax=Leifsonia poae TaxID=110933 RepID=UPI001CC04D00|nr:copper resistance CopC family protein [Leifsonia poae]
MRSLRVLTASLAATGAVALALLPAVGASAHDYLVNSSPAADSVVTEPLQRVTLTFNDRVLDLSGDGSSSLVTVTGPDSRHFETGCATTADTVVSAPVSLGSAGKYTITYQIVSADGHTVSNSLGFTYQPPAGTVAAAGSDGTVCGKKGGDAVATDTATAPAAPPTETAGSAAPTQPSADSGNLGPVIGIAIGIVVLAIAGVLVVVLTGRRKPPTATPEDPHDDEADKRNPADG